MKIVKILLSIILLLVIVLTTGIIFSNNIVYYMTRTKDTRFENIKYSVEKGTMTFDDLILDKKSFGKGSAKVKLEREGFLGLVPRLTLSEVKLENVDMNDIYGIESKQIDSFIGKIDEQYSKTENDLTLEKYVDNVGKNVDNLNSSINDFTENKISGNISKINQIKQDYSNSSKINEKSIKIAELNKETTNLIKVISKEKLKYEEEIENIEAEKNEVLLKFGQNVENLQKEIELNNVNKLYEYIFLDKDEKLKDVENKSLKLFKFVNEIKKLSFKITDLDINNGEIKITNIGQNKLNVEATMSENVIVKGEGTLNNYNIDINFDDMKILTKYTVDQEIVSDIIYMKKDLLKEKNVEIKVNLLFKGNNFSIQNKTILTAEEQNNINLLNEEIENAGYNEKLNEYKIQNEKIDGFINILKENLMKLDKVQNDILKIDVIIPINSEKMEYIKEEDIEMKDEKKDKPSQNEQIKDFIGKMLGKKGSK